MIESSADCADDWMLLAQRGMLNAGEWQTRMAHLRVCADCRQMWLTAQAFQLTDGVAAGDELVIGRAVNSALATAARVDSPGLIKLARRHVVGFSKLRLTLAAAAAMVFMMTVASAGIFIHRRSQPVAEVDPKVVDPKATSLRRSPPLKRTVAPPPLAQPPAQAAPPRASLAAVDLPPRPVASPASSPTSVGRLERISAAEPRKVADARRSSPTTAALLFAQATSARQAGHLGEAVDTFRRLHRDFGSTWEGKVCLVSLGSLLAEMALPEQALVAFDAYLSESPAGTLAPEALAGKFRALARLGRRDDANLVHQELQRRYPDTVYARALGGRLSER